MAGISILSDFEDDRCFPVRDPLWKHIYFPLSFRGVLQDPVFLRLGRLKQLGAAFHVYPGAVHTRLNHSLGVYHIAKRIISQLLKHNDAPSLSQEGVTTFLLASLLHDVGHYPYAHLLHGHTVEEHEILSGQTIMDSSLTKVLKRMGVDPSAVAAIIDWDIPVDEGSEILFYRRLLSGVLDPDKLDYLNRDAYFCGVPYGLQDTDHVIHSIRPYSQGLILGSNGIPAVENLLFSKYLMYKTVYWHRLVRLPSALICRALYQGLELGLLSSEVLYKMDDESFYMRKGKGLENAFFDVIEEAIIPGQHAIAVERCFNRDSPLHRKLETLSGRMDYEEKLRDYFSSELGEFVAPGALLLDLPPDISFEVALSLRKNGSTELCSFVESGSVFSGPVVKQFTATLRTFLLIVAQPLFQRLSQYPRLLQEVLI